MKILAFTDVHGSKEKLAAIKEKDRLYNPDVLVCSGDLSMFEERLHVLLRELDSLHKPMFIIPGNHENEIALERASHHFRNINYLHKKSMELGDYVFFGYGGNAFVVEDHRFSTLAKHFQQAMSRSKKHILITHTPPHSTAVDMIDGVHLGNKSYREFLSFNTIHLHICGHLHENANKEDLVGLTRIINPGPFGKIIEI